MVFSTSGIRGLGLLLCLLLPASGLAVVRPNATPMARYGGASACDAAGQRLIIFGGDDGGYRSDVATLTSYGSTGSFTTVVPGGRPRGGAPSRPHAGTPSGAASSYSAAQTAGTSAASPS